MAQHELLTEFAQNLWIAEGPEIRFFGLFPYPTRMLIVRLEDGTSWLWSPIPWTKRLGEAVGNIGPVRHIVAPSKLHHLFVQEWKRENPEARVYAAPGLPSKRPDLHFDSELNDDATPPWYNEIPHIVFSGSRFLVEVEFFHRVSRTAIVVDLIQRLPEDLVSGLPGRLLRLNGLVGERGGTPLDARLTFFHRQPAREARDRLLSLQPERLVIAHGLCAREKATEILARAFAWLG